MVIGHASTRLAAVGLVVALKAAAATATLTAAEGVDFNQQIRPLFAAHCYECHGPETVESGLRLDQRSAAMRGGDSGPVIAAGQSAASEIIRRVTAVDPDERMPPVDDATRPLAPEQIEVLKRWIDQGADWPTTNDHAGVVSNHWSLQPVRPVTPPVVKDTAWPRNDIDRFVLAALEARAISPSPEADRYTLIKRLYYDLIGLPPEPPAVEAYLRDEPAEAYERLVDRLLASPRFGERWARHWLDKARYADSDGYEKDRPRPEAWRYRDWVIDAINNDLPFDRFTVEQLAGDLLPDAGYSQLLATAFHRQTLTNTEGGTDQEEFRVAAVMDRVNTTGTVWLGLTIGCAQCHSHKYDPLTQADYYRLFAFFNNGDETTTDAPVSEEALAEYEKESAEYELKLAALEQSNAADRQEQIKKLEKQQPQQPAVQVRVIRERTKDPRTTHILRRGDFLQPQAAVTPGPPEVLPEFHPRTADRPADRLDLAHWLMDEDNPLTSRVAVNHVWSHLLGAGLVRTADDFGSRGEVPSHPDLLDWLARRYVELGWSRKSLIRLVVTSATYRQASRHRPELDEVDAENRLLYRQNRWRVEGEIVRDLHLAASGLLSRKIGGPSVFPPMPPDVAELSYAGSFKWKSSEGEDRYRRGMYTFFKRTAPHPNLMTFDCPNSNTTAVRRTVSNTPLQALTTLNNEVFVEASQALARRALDDCSGGDAQRVAYAFRLCAVRPPTPAELAALSDLLVASRDWYAAHDDQALAMAGSQLPRNLPTSEAAAWVAVTRVIMNVDEYITRE